MGKRYLNRTMLEQHKIHPSSKRIKRTTTSSCDYGVASHPTQYNGVNYRSRLEAKWAAFFDVLEWKFQYEPVDFNGWSPDFLIMGHRNVYVEVKPIVVNVEPVEIIDKLLSSGCNDEMLIVGMSPLARKDDDRAILGWLAEDRCFGTSVFGMWQEVLLAFVMTTCLTGIASPESTTGGAVYTNLSARTTS